jgi:hypothetical protein
MQSPASVQTKSAFPGASPASPTITRVLQSASQTKHPATSSSFMEMGVSSVSNFLKKDSEIGRFSTRTMYRHYDLLGTKKVFEQSQRFQSHLLHKISRLNLL